MRKVTKQNALAINTIMLATIASYIKCFATGQTDVNSLQMYADDVAHNVAALQVFNSTKNAQNLHNSIMLQDTLVREYFITALRYIENNNLIAAHNFCCT
jgi:hypothetical protein